jgi:hypothetical protein
MFLAQRLPVGHPHLPLLDRHTGDEHRPERPLPHPLHPVFPAGW